MKRKTKYLTANKRNKAAQRAYDGMVVGARNKTPRDTYSLIEVDVFAPRTDGSAGWHVLYTDFDGSEITVATDLTLTAAKKLVKERTKRDPLPDAMMKHLAF